MDATFSDSLATAPVDSPEFKSRPGALAWSFRKSRDRWKDKYKKLKIQLKRSTNRVADVTKSREHWKAQAQASRKELGAREHEIVTLRQQIASMELKKRSTPAACH
jgi:septal ring factor EnvC (AmiA/AmiB activator)